MVNGKKIRELREAASLTTLDLGRELGVSPATITYVELGSRKPSVELLARIAQYFQVTIDELIINEPLYINR